MEEILTTQLITSDVLLSFIGGTVLTAVVAVLRKWSESRKVKLSRPQTQLIVLAGAVIMGVTYTAFGKFVSPDLQTALIDFMWKTATACVFIYEFIWKNLFGSVKK